MAVMGGHRSSFSRFIDATCDDDGSGSSGSGGGGDGDDSEEERVHGDERIHLAQLE